MESALFDSLQRPSLYLYATELFRALNEREIGRIYLKKVPKNSAAQAIPVLVIPGFMASASSTKGLRKLIYKMGHTPYDWQLGRNYGDLQKVDRLEQLLQDIAQKEQQKVAIIGWSLGGIFARELAKKYPSIVKQVITLASPFNGVTQPNNATWLFRLLNGGRRVEEVAKDWLPNLSAPAPIKTTCIYSKKDGIVPWQACLERQEDDLHQNIEVMGSHIGLGFNVQVYKIIQQELR